jgi:hypothetical protein
LGLGVWSFSVGLAFSHTLGHCLWLPDIVMLNQLTISELVQRLAKREASSVAATQACLDRIKQVDSQVRAFLSYDAKDALAQAEGADRAMAWVCPLRSKMSLPSKASR